MKKLIVEFSEGTLDVADMDGNRCSGLTIGEVIEQITHMHYKNAILHQMKTTEEWNEWREKNAARLESAMPF